MKKYLKNGVLVKLDRHLSIDDKPELCAYLDRLISLTADMNYCSKDTVWEPENTGAITLREEETQKLIGIIAFKHTPPFMHDDKKLLQIIIGGVSEEYRGQGGYYLLHEELENFTKELGWDGIYSFIRANNIPMMNALRPLKKQIFGVLCYKEI